MFIFFGLVATGGTVLVETGGLPLLAVLAGILPGALAAAVLLVNNIRDRAQDELAGKRTLAVILGAAGARRPLFGLLGLALAVPLFITIPGIETFTLFLPWLAAPLLEAPVRNSGSADPADQVRALKQMGGPCWRSARSSWLSGSGPADRGVLTRPFRRARLSRL